jgi:PAS domain-containing protein
MRSRLFAYAVAVLATFLCLLIRWPLWPVLGTAVPHVTFFPAVMIAAYVGGFWPGISATLLSAVAANYFLTGQFRSFDFTNVNDVTALVLFVLIGAIISGLCEWLHRARHRIVAEERKRAEEAVSQDDCHTRWVSTTKMPLRDKEGATIGTFGLARDITKLKTAEQALRESEQRFRGTFENAAVGIAHTHPTGRFLRLNQKFCAIVGYTREELLQKTF